MSEIEVTPLNYIKEFLFLGLILGTIIYSNMNRWLKLFILFIMLVLGVYKWFNPDKEL